MTVKEILKNLYGITEPNGLTDEEFEYFEKRFGKLPEPLREFYSLCGHCESVKFIQDEWLLPEDYKKWRWLDDTKDFIIVNENQAVCQAYIKESDLSLSNPPVYVTHDNGKTGTLCAKSLDDFIKAFLVYQSVFSIKFNSEAFYLIDGDDYKCIQSRLKEYPFEILSWCNELSIKLFYDSPDSAVFVIGDNMLYGANSKKSFEKLQRLLNGIGDEM